MKKRKKKKKKQRKLNPPRNLIVPLMHLHTKPGPHKVKKEPEVLKDWESEY